MAKHAIKTDGKTSLSLANVVLPAIAVSLIILGVVGLVVATVTKSKEQADTRSDGQALQVIDGLGRYPQDNQAAAGALQGAARVNDLIQDKKADDLQGKTDQNLQQGTNLDALLESTDLSVD